MDLLEFFNLICDQLELVNSYFVSMFDTGVIIFVKLFVLTVLVHFRDCPI